MISMAGIIPYAGDLAKGAKYGSKLAKQTTIIGSRTDTMKYLGRQGYNVLNTNNWTPKNNLKWLDKAIKRGDDIVLATDPLKHQELIRDLDTFSAYTDLELPHLLEKGFAQFRKKMIK